jgi:hypothetical protein
MAVYTIEYVASMNSVDSRVTVYEPSRTRCEYWNQRSR